MSDEVEFDDFEEDFDDSEEVEAYAAEVAKAAEVLGIEVPE